MKSVYILLALLLVIGALWYETSRLRGEIQRLEDTKEVVADTVFVTETITELIRDTIEVTTIVEVPVEIQAPVPDSLGVRRGIYKSLFKDEYIRGEIVSYTENYTVTSHHFSYQTVQPWENRYTLTQTTVNKTITYQRPRKWSVVVDGDFRENGFRGSAMLYHPRGIGVGGSYDLYTGWGLKVGYRFDL